MKVWRMGQGYAGVSFIKALRANLECLPEGAGVVENVRRAVVVGAQRRRRSTERREVMVRLLRHN